MLVNGLFATIKQNTQVDDTILFNSDGRTLSPTPLG